MLLGPQDELHVEPQTVEALVCESTHPVTVDGGVVTVVAGVVAANARWVKRNEPLQQHGTSTQPAGKFLAEVRDTEGRTNRTDADGSLSEALQKSEHCRFSYQKSLTVCTAG